MLPRPHVLAELAWRAERDRAIEVAVLPWGATEAHNTHLPYATDTIAAERVATNAAGIAWDRGAGIVVLPAVPFGVHTGQRDVPFCLNVNPSTQFRLLSDIASSLVPHGVRKLLIVNGHGANDFRPMIRELQGAVPLFICTLNWFSVLDPRDFFTNPGDHAGELETSAMMHLSPDLVRPLAEAGPGAAKSFRIAGLRVGWVWAPRRWSQVTSDTGSGSPAAATKLSGGRFVDAATTRIAEFLVDLAAADLDDLYV